MRNLVAPWKSPSLCSARSLGYPPSGSRSPEYPLCPSCCLSPVLIICVQELVTSAPMAGDSHRQEVGRWGDSFFFGSALCWIRETTSKLRHCFGLGRAVLPFMWPHSCIQDQGGTACSTALHADVSLCHFSTAPAWSCCSHGMSPSHQFLLPQISSSGGWSGAKVILTGFSPFILLQLHLMGCTEASLPAASSVFITVIASHSQKHGIAFFHNLW